MEPFGGWKVWKEVSKAGGEVKSDTGLDRGEDFTFYSESGGSHRRVLSRRGDVS